MVYKIKPKIVTFAEGTDKEIADMLKAHYRGQINISDYWHVGDTRVVHLSATSADGGITHSANHAAQDMTMVIYGFNHDDLTTPINGKEKAAVTVGFREAMGSGGSKEYEYYWGKSYYPVADTDNYLGNPLRTWLNGGLLNSLPDIFSSIIKEVNKKNLQYPTNSNGAPLITQDKIWLLSYPEVFGTTKWSGYLKGINPSNYEGEQYDYMKTISNRIKKANDNGSMSSTSSLYWLRSPSSDYFSTIGHGWCYVESSDAGRTNGNGSAGLSPAFCL